MFEKGIFHQPFSPEDIHHRNGIVQHPQGNIFRGKGGKDRSLGWR